MTTPSERATMLTDAQIDKINCDMWASCPLDLWQGRAFARAVERALLARLWEQQPVAWMWRPSKELPDMVFSDNPRRAEQAAGFGLKVQPLYTAPGSAQAAPAPGMAVQALAAEICQALADDAKSDGYDLEAGMFGAKFSALVRRWAALEYAAPIPSPAPDQQATPKPISDKDLGAINECQQATPSPAPVGAQEREAFEQLLSDFERACSERSRLHGEYMGKAMPDHVFETFSTLRDERIPELRKALAARSAAQGAVRVPAGWRFTDNGNRSITVSRGGYSCVLWKIGQGGVESLAYEMAAMLAAAPAHAGERQGDSA